jgi:hypothetical protein
MNTRAPCCVIIFLIVLLLSFSTFSYATTAEATEELTFTLKAPKDGTTDLHLEFHNASQFKIIHAESDKLPSHSEKVINDTNGEAIFTTNKELVLKEGEKVTVTIDIWSAVNQWGWDKLSWSFADGTKKEIEPNRNDLTVTAVGDPTSLFSITNASDDYVTYLNLSYLNNVLQLPPLTPIGATPGFSQFASQVILLPHSVSPEYLFPNLDPGNFLYIEGTWFVSDSQGQSLYAEDTVTLRFGHQRAPIPGTLLLLGSGLTALGWSVIRKK